MGEGKARSPAHAGGKHIGRHPRSPQKGAGLARLCASSGASFCPRIRQNLRATRAERCRPQTAPDAGGGAAPTHFFCRNLSALRFFQKTPRKARRPGCSPHRTARRPAGGNLWRRSRRLTIPGVSHHGTPQRPSRENSLGCRAPYRTRCFRNRLTPELWHPSRGNAGRAALAALPFNNCHLFTSC